MVMEYMEQQMQNQSEAAENEREQLLNEIVKLEQNLEAVQAERDALAAQVEVLQSAIRESNRYLVSKLPADFHWPAFLNSPAARLAQVRAEAGRAGYAECALDFGLCSTDEQRAAVVTRADQYAETIRQEVK
jgi:hypothetical protein